MKKIFSWPFLSKVKPVLGKTGKFFLMIWKYISGISLIVCRKVKAFCRTRTCGIIFRTLVILLIVCAFLQVVFGVLIYGFRDRDYSGDSPVKYIYRAANSNVTKIAGEITPYPVAVVDYSFVTYKDYLSEKTYIHHFYGATNQEGVDFKQIDRQIVDQLIENKLIEFEALHYGVRVKKSDVDDAIKSIIDQNGGQANVEKILNDLYGLSLNDFRRLVETQLLRDQVNQKVIAKVSVQHILISVDKSAPQDQVDAAKAKIDDIRNQIENGSISFDDAAKKSSEDVGSASNGGTLDPFAKGDMVAQFSDAAFATKVGEISQPVRSDFGWHIIKVNAKTGTIEKSFSDWVTGIKAKSLMLKFYEI